MYIVNNNYPHHEVALLSIIFATEKFCENFTNEDNLNNTFYGKVLPHTTVVATEFKAKIQVF